MLRCCRVFLSTPRVCRVLTCYCETICYFLFATDYTIEQSNYHFHSLVAIQLTEFFEKKKGKKEKEKELNLILILIEK